MRIATAVLVAAIGVSGSAPASAQAPGATRRDPILDKYDKDGNGRLDRAEWRAWRMDRRAAMIKKYDKDKNGRLDARERGRFADDRTAFVYANLDRNKDGKLTTSEVNQSRSLEFEPLRRSLLRRYDGDDDGVVTRAEFATTLRSYGPGLGRHGRGGRHGGRGGGGGGGRGYGPGNGGGGRGPR